MKINNLHENTLRTFRLNSENLFEQLLQAAAYSSGCQLLFRLSSSDAMTGRSVVNEMTKNCIRAISTKNTIKIRISRQNNNE